MSAFADPASGVVAVTPSDSVAITGGPVRALWVGTGGNIALVAADGTTATITNVANGTLVPISVVRVNSTNTTASAIIGLR